MPDTYRTAAQNSTVSPLDRPFRFTRFKNRSASTKVERTASLRDVAAMIEKATAAAKADLPWTKFAVFGDTRTSLRPHPSESSRKTGGSLRHDANVIAVTGVEADYDGEVVTLEEARRAIETAGLTALLYTTPSHEPDAPRWRVFAPFSAELPTEARARHLARLNGVLNGVLADESFVLSQAYYGGSVEGRPRVSTILVNGRRYLDEADDLDAGAIGKRGRTKTADGHEAAGDFDEAAALEAIRTGDSYHPAAIALAGRWAEQGVAYVEALARLRTAFDAVPETERDLRWRERFASLPEILVYVYGKEATDEAAERERRERVFDDVTIDAETQAEIDEAIARLVGRPGQEHRGEGLTFVKPSECDGADARPYVVKGLIAEGDIGCIVGAPGVGKSLIGPRLAYAVAQGEAIFGLKTKPGRVFYVATEDHKGMKARVVALRQDNGEADGFDLVGGVSDLMTPNSPHLKALRTAVAEHRPALIVIDTLADGFPGLEENDAKSMSRVVEVARSLTKWGAAVLLIHHDTKDGQQGLPRGHSRLNGALDVSLHLTKSDGVVRGRLTKNRNGSSERDIAFTIGVRTVGMDEDGEPIRTALCCPLASAPEREAKMPDSAKAALSVLRDLVAANAGHGVSRDAWREAAISDTGARAHTLSTSDTHEGRKRAFNRALGALLAHGSVVESEGVFTLSSVRGEEVFPEHDEGADHGLV